MPFSVCPVNTSAIKCQGLMESLSCQAGNRTEGPSRQNQALQWWASGLCVGVGVSFHGPSEYCSVFEHSVSVIRFKAVAKRLPTTKEKLLMLLCYQHASHCSSVRQKIEVNRQDARHIFTVGLNRSIRANCVIKCPLLYLTMSVTVPPYSASDPWVMLLLGRIPFTHYIFGHSCCETWSQTYMIGHHRLTFFFTAAGWVLFFSSTTLSTPLQQNTPTLIQMNGRTGFSLQWQQC